MDGTDYKKEQKDRWKWEEYDVIIEHHQSIGVVSSVKGEGNGNPLQYSCLENPWTEGPGRLQSMGSLRVGHD